MRLEQVVQCLKYCPPSISWIVPTLIGSSGTLVTYVMCMHRINIVHLVSKLQSLDQLKSILSLQCTKQIEVRLVFLCECCQSMQQYHLLNNGTSPCFPPTLYHRSSHRFRVSRKNRKLHKKHSSELVQFWQAHVGIEWHQACVSVGLSACNRAFHLSINLQFQSSRSKTETFTVISLENMSTGNELKEFLKDGVGIFSRVVILLSKICPPLMQLVQPY